MKHFLSTLKNAQPGAITYYDGDDPLHVTHLHSCTLICKPTLKIGGISKSVTIITDDNPQLYFYKISSGYKENYLEYHKMEYSDKWKSYIHKDAILGNVKIGPNCVIGNCTIKDQVEIGPNTTIYNKTYIRENTTIGSNCSIGTQGMMWCWDGNKKVYLEQLGWVEIGQNVVIGSGCNIVRGSVNEATIINNNVNLAPGCNIGHGTFIGENTHLANGINTGGSSYIEKNCFIGSGTTILPGKRITNEDVIVGGGTNVSKDIILKGVYVGNPVRKMFYSQKSKLKGVPTWKNLQK